MGSYKGTGAADFVLTSRVSYYAHTYSVFKVRKPEAFKIPPLSFGHTMPAIAYTSGMFSLPSAAARGACSARRSLSGCLGSHQSSRPDEQRIARIGAVGQPLSTGSPIGTQWHGAHLLTGTARARASTIPRVRLSSGRGELKYIK